MPPAWHEDGRGNVAPALLGVGDPDTLSYPGFASMEWLLLGRFSCHVAIVSITLTSVMGQLPFVGDL